MHSHDAIVDLAAVAIVLSRGAHGFAATLADAGLVHAADGLGMRVVSDHQLLAAVSQFFFIPLDRFEEALQRAGRRPELQGDGLGILAVQAGELPFDINLQQPPRVTPAKTIGEQREKRSQLPSECGDLL